MACRVSVRERRVSNHLICDDELAFVVEPRLFFFIAADRIRLTFPL